VALASTFLILNAAAATCLTRTMLRLLVVDLETAHAALLHATTNAANVRGAEPNFHPTMPHLHAAVSSRMKTFPAISTASS
jgi:hypothetical protein